MYINKPEIYIDIIYEIRSKSLNGEKLSFSEMFFVNLIMGLIDEHLDKGGLAQVFFEKMISEIDKSSEDFKK